MKEKHEREEYLEVLIDEIKSLEEEVAPMREEMARMQQKEASDQALIDQLSALNARLKQQRSKGTTVSALHSRNTNIGTPMRRATS